MTAALITPPAIEPVSLEEAKDHLRLDGEDEDQLVDVAIVSARRHVEATTRRVLIAQGWRVFFDAWPRKRMVAVPVAPLISVESVKVFDASGAPVTLDPTDYEVDAVSVPGRLAVRSPLAARRLVNGIAIELTAGYGAAASDVPAPLRHAILMLVAHWYEHRAAAGDVGDTLPFGFAAMTAPYRILSL